MHFHSLYSDGKLSVPELVNIIKEKKLEYCALADHNTVDGIRELMKFFAGTETRVIPATELTAKYKDNEVHILAYDFDTNAAAEILTEHNEIVRQKKIGEMEASLNLCQKAGLLVANNLAPSEKQPVGLTVALDICANSSNQEFFISRRRILQPFKAGDECDTLSERKRGYARLRA